MKHPATVRCWKQLVKATSHVLFAFIVLGCSAVIAEEDDLVIIADSNPLAMYPASVVLSYPPIEDSNVNEMVLTIDHDRDADLISNICLAHNGNCLAIREEIYDLAPHPDMNSIRLIIYPGISGPDTWTAHLFYDFGEATRVDGEWERPLMMVVFTARGLEAASILHYDDRLSHENIFGAESGQ